MYDFLFVTGNNYMPTCGILGDLAIQNIPVHELEFDLSRLLRVKVYWVIRMSTYLFLLVNNGEYIPMCSILRDIAIQNIHDLEFDFSRSLKVKVDVKAHI